jgi:hypothetical protein
MPAAPWQLLPSAEHRGNRDRPVPRALRAAPATVTAAATGPHSPQLPHSSRACTIPKLGGNHSLCAPYRNTSHQLDSLP